MIIGRVAGRVVQTIQHPSTANRRLLVIDRLDLDGAPDGGYLVAVDSVGAGHGETVLVLDEGNGARQVLQWENAPVRSVVVGVVDAVHGRRGPVGER
jgi:microcompartment protein CcmK/EutM